MPFQPFNQLSALRIEQHQGRAFTGGDQQAAVRAHGHAAGEGHTGALIDLVCASAQNVHFARQQIAGWAAGLGNVRVKLDGLAQYLPGLAVVLQPGQQRRVGEAGVEELTDVLPLLCLCLLGLALRCFRNQSLMLDFVAPSPLLRLALFVPRFPAIFENFHGQIAIAPVTGSPGFGGL
jgi:hypothetical protein